MKTWKDIAEMTAKLFEERDRLMAALERIRTMQPQKGDEKAREIANAALGKTMPDQGNRDDLDIDDARDELARTKEAVEAAEWNLASAKRRWQRDRDRREGKEMM